MTSIDTKRDTQFVQVEGKKIQLTVHGSGPPLLYLHSAAGEADWQSFHEQLAQHFKLYVPAHPGFCLSTGLESIHSVADYAWHYVDLLDHLEIESIPILGFSLGAWIGLELALLRPERVSHLTLTAAAGLHLDEAPMAELFIDDLDELRELLFFDPNAECVGEVMPSSVEDPRILNWLRAREATARVGWNPYLHNPRLKEHLRRIENPTRIIWGRHDRLIPVAHGEYYAEHLPHADLQVIEDCGHMVPYEATQTFVELATHV